MFQILSGVRRSKVKQLAGHATILADIYASSGARVDQREIALDTLYSPKDEIDLRASANDLIRFRRLQGFLLAGLEFDAIEVTPGRKGTLLSQVLVLV